MSLREDIQSLTGIRRRFILLRIAHLDPESARKIVGIKKGTYNNWCNDETFVSVHSKIRDYSQEYRQEAVQLLRRDNQLDAVLLEAKVIAKIREEIDSGKYDLIRTNLARVVYDKLISDLDFQPKELSLTWQQRINQMYSQPPEQVGTVPQLIEGSND